MSIKYVAGWNMPGYLPETDPQEFDNLAEAREYIVDEIRHLASGLEEQALYEEAMELAADIDLSYCEFTTEVLPDGYVYWLQATGQSEEV